MGFCTPEGKLYDDAAEYIKLKVGIFGSKLGFGSKRLQEKQESMLPELAQKESHPHGSKTRIEKKDVHPTHDMISKSMIEIVSICGGYLDPISDSSESYKVYFEQEKTKETIVHKLQELAKQYKDQDATNILSNMSVKLQEQIQSRQNDIIAKAQKDEKNKILKAIERLSDQYETQVVAEILSLAYKELQKQMKVFKYGPRAYEQRERMLSEIENIFEQHLGRPLLKQSVQAPETTAMSESTVLTSTVSETPSSAPANAQVDHAKMAKTPSLEHVSVAKSNKKSNHGGQSFSEVIKAKKAEDELSRRERSRYIKRMEESIANDPSHYFDRMQQAEEKLKKWCIEYIKCHVVKDGSRVLAEGLFSKRKQEAKDELLAVIRQVANQYDISRVITMRDEVLNIVASPIRRGNVYGVIRQAEQQVVLNDIRLVFDEYLKSQGFDAEGEPIISRSTNTASSISTSKQEIPNQRKQPVTWQAIVAPVSTSNTIAQTTKIAEYTEEQEDFPALGQGTPIAAIVGNNPAVSERKNRNLLGNIKLECQNYLTSCIGPVVESAKQPKPSSDKIKALLKELSGRKDINIKEALDGIASELEKSTRLKMAPQQKTDLMKEIRELFQACQKQNEKMQYLVKIAILKKEVEKEGVNLLNLYDDINALPLSFDDQETYANRARLLSTISDKFTAASDPITSLACCNELIKQYWQQGCELMHQFQNSKPAHNIEDLSMLEKSISAMNCALDWFKNAEHKFSTLQVDQKSLKELADKYFSVNNDLKNHTGLLKQYDVKQCLSNFLLKWLEEEVNVITQQKAQHDKEYPGLSSSSAMLDPADKAMQLEMRIDECQEYLEKFYTLQATIESLKERL